MTMYLWLILAVLTGCTPSIETEEGVDTREETEEHAWATWETCGQKPGDNPCNFELTNQHGELVELYDFHEKVIVVDLSTMWCSVCQNIATKGDELTVDYGDVNFVWLTVLVENASGDDPTVDDLNEWVTTYGITANVLAGDRSLVDLNAVTGYPVSGWPTLAVIDQNMVLYSGVNGWSESMIRGWVETLLEE